MNLSNAAAPGLIRGTALRAPATLAVALAAALTTAIGASRALGDPWEWPAAAAWLMHGDARHLVCDVAALVAIGLWLEPRAGSRRLLLWMLVSGAACAAAHAAFHPEQSRLFGLSGTTYALVFAGVCGWALDRAWGVALLAGLIAVLVGEWVRGESATQWATAAAGEALGAGGGWGTAFVDGPLMSTPRVHVACVALGVGLGLAVRVGRHPFRTAITAVAERLRACRVSAPR